MSEETQVQRIEQQILALDPDAEFSPEQVAEVINCVEWFLGRAKEMKSLLDERLLELLSVDGGREVVIGTVKYFVGPKKTVKCRDVKVCLEALFESTAGDFDRVTDCLSANAIKHGAARQVLGDQFDRHFEVIEDKDLKTGKVTKQVKRVDSRFIR